MQNIIFHLAKFGVMRSVNTSSKSVHKGFSTL